MADWVNNFLWVGGKEEDLNKFRLSVGNEKYPMDFNKIIPIPEKFKETDIIGFEYFFGDSEVTFIDCSEWCSRNWGTNRNCRCWDFTIGEDYLGYTFETAWEAPCYVIEKLIETYPGLEICFSYDDYWTKQGWIKGKNGKIMEDYWDRFEPGYLDGMLDHCDIEGTEEVVED